MITEPLEDILKEDSVDEVSMDELFRQAQNITRNKGTVDDTLVSWSIMDEHLPPEFDPSIPFSPVKYENFIMLIWRGVKGWEAYKNSIDHRKSKQLASRAAKVLLAKTAFIERLGYLSVHKEEEKEQSARAESAGINSKWQLEQLIKTTNVETTKIRAIAELEKLKASEESDNKVVARPDPAFVVEYLCGFAGFDPDDYVKHLGGLPEIMNRIKTLCHVENVDIMKALEFKD